MDFSRSDFPQGFLFSAATSSYQIEGHGFGGAGKTHWDTFAATPGNVVRAEHGQLACDHYNRFEEDLDLARDMGLDAYRFSTSWARVMPDGRGAVNTEGLDFYDRLVDAMLERGLKPQATLYHWELPVALADLGGWRNPDIAHWFGDFTTVVMERIGDRVFSAAPINEPWCVGWLSHFEGHHAPGLRDIRAAAHAMHHVLTAHGRSVQAMRALGVQNVGAVCNFEASLPADSSPAAAAAAQLYDGIYNRFFIGGLFQGAYPQDVMEGLAPHMPKDWQDDFDLIGQKLDWFGLNYYTRKLIGANDGAWPSYDYIDGPLPKTQMGWEIYPEGLHQLLVWVEQNYTKGLPLFVTENGMSNADTVGRDDVERMAYLDSHLAACKNAIRDGANLRGYTFWSLLDNYEWALGYEKRFGLIHVDFETLERSPKASYYAVARALAE
jgi:beta-glucosidase